MDVADIILQGMGLVGPTEGCLLARNLQGLSGVGRPGPGGPWIQIRRMSSSGPISKDKVHAVESWRVSTSVFCRPLLIGTVHEIKYLPLASN
jgi:hypothetical protein